MVFKFSFLLSIPAIIGDLGVEAYLQQGTFAQGVGVSAIDLLVGLAVYGGCRLLSYCTGEKAGFNQTVPLLCRLFVCPWSNLDCFGSLRILRRVFLSVTNLKTKMQKTN